MNRKVPVPPATAVASADPAKALLVADREWLFDGYRRALARYRGVAAARDPKETFIPIFEALNWAVTIADRLKKDRVGLDRHLKGLQWARNVVHHHWGQALQPRDFFLAPITARRAGQPWVNPGPFFDWFWKQPQELPDPEPPAPKLEAAYRDLLAGHQAREALEAIERFFDSLIKTERTED